MTDTNANHELTDEELEAQIEALTEENPELEQDYKSIGFVPTEEV